MTTIAPYGSWKSPITTQTIVAKTISLGKIRIDGDTIYWLESRPEEQGRSVIVRLQPGGQAEDLFPIPFNARTRVHEYGGGEYLVDSGVVYFSNFNDQRLYRLVPGAEPQPLTPPEDLRYADGVMDRQRGRIVCVREDHTHAGQEAVNTLVALDAAGADLLTGGTVLVSGADFYSNPRLSPDGSRLAWLCWKHPNMPWDETELWVAEIAEDGGLVNSKRVAGGNQVSIFQPEWSPDGQLYFVSDQTGWWNLYRWEVGQNNLQAIHPMEAEFGQPAWVFGMTTYVFESADRLVCAYQQNGQGYLAMINTRTLEFTILDLPYTEFHSLAAQPGYIFFDSGSPVSPSALVRIRLEDNQTAVIKKSTEQIIDPGYLSSPQSIAFPTEGGLTAYGIFYPPHNQDFGSPEGEKPPLLVMSHGGPTGATSTSFSPRIQYWTSRGIAVLDVNYRGSSGYGRTYRDLLKGQWGIADVDDCINGALYLCRQGLADENRLAIRGGSAGGYTTLCAITFRNAFKAGASHFGISDAEALALDTHKFESRYLDGLIGPYPAMAELYRQRSPIYYTNQINCGLILFQGSEDRVVPPEQSRKMFEAVRARKLPVAYIEFEGEQHGFRKAENIQRSLEAELYFYSKIFHFGLADDITPVPIENL